MLQYFLINPPFFCAPLSRYQVVVSLYPVTDWVPTKHSPARESSSMVGAFDNLSVADGKGEIQVNEADSDLAVCEVAGSKNQKLNADSTPPANRRKIHRAQSILPVSIYVARFAALFKPAP